MTVLQKAALAAASWLESSRKFGPPPVPTPAPRPRPNPLRGSGVGVASVRSTIPTPVTPRPVAVAAAPERRVAIVPAGERERRRLADDRRRADRRAQDLGSPYGVERRSGNDDRQADRRGLSKRPAGIGLMRDYFAHAEERAVPQDTSLPAGLVVRFHD